MIQKVLWTSLNIFFKIIYCASIRNWCFSKRLYHHKFEICPHQFRIIYNLHNQFELSHTLIKAIKCIQHIILKRLIFAWHIMYSVYKSKQLIIYCIYPIYSWLGTWKLISINQIEYYIIIQTCHHIILYMQLIL